MTTIMLAISSTTFFGEYIDPTKYVKTALGIELWIKIIPAEYPDKLNISITIKPIIGPKINLAIEPIIDSFNEKIFNLVKAIPSDINTRKIVVYVNSIVVLRIKLGVSNSK